MYINLGTYFLQLKPNITNLNVNKNTMKVLEIMTAFLCNLEMGKAFPMIQNQDQHGKRVRDFIS